MRVRRETGAFRPAPRGGGASAHAPAQRALPRACGMGHLNSTASSLLPVMRSERLARARKAKMAANVTGGVAAHLEQKRKTKNQGEGQC